MRKLPSVSEMEHITSKEFGEQMEAVMDRITKEDIAMIIDHEGKSYVLCPASWFDIPEMKHIEVMLKNAIRYVAAVDDTDLNETIDMVREFAPALSPEFMEQLLEIIQKSHPESENEGWVRLKTILQAAMPATEKEE